MLLELGVRFVMQIVAQVTPVAEKTTLPPDADGSRILAVTVSVFAFAAVLVPIVQFGHVYVPVGPSVACPLGKLKLPPPPVTVHVTIAPPTGLLPRCVVTICTAGATGSVVPTSAV